MTALPGLRLTQWDQAATDLLPMAVPRYGTSWVAQHEWLVVGLHNFYAFRVVRVIYVIRVILCVHITTLLLHAPYCIMLSFTYLSCSRPCSIGLGMHHYSTTVTTVQHQS